MTTSMGIRLRATHTSAFSRREGVRGVREFSAFHWEGRGECREPTHPQPRMQSKKAYELVTTGKPDYPAFPHAMVLTVSFVISPVIGLSCHRRLASAAKLDASVEASGPHDFAVRVQHRSSAVPNSVHRIPPRVRDDRERPLVGRDGAIRKVFRLGEEPIYFSDWGSTAVLPVRQNHWRTNGPRLMRGNTILNSVNSPGLVSTSIVPPCCLTMMSWLIERPSPVPSPAGLVVKNGLKIFSVSSAGMPVPLSRTRISTAPPISLVEARSTGLKSGSPIS